MTASLCFTLCRSKRAILRTCSHVVQSRAENETMPANVCAWRGLFQRSAEAARQQLRCSRAQSEWRQTQQLARARDHHRKCAAQQKHKREKKKKVGPVTCVT